MINVRPTGRPWGVTKFNVVIFSDVTKMKSESADYAVQA